MKNLNMLLLCLGVTLLFPNITNAQFGKLLERTTKKSAEKAEDRIIEKGAEEISDEVDKKVDKWLDKVFNGSDDNNENTSEENTTTKDSNEEYQINEEDAKRIEEAMGIYMNSMDRTADVPSSYEFNLIVEAEQYEEGEKPHPMTMMFNTGNHKHFGIINKDGKEINTVVMDTENDIMVTYMTDKKGNKSAHALPNMMKMAGAFANKDVTPSDDDDTSSPPTFRKTGKTKTIAGYTANEYVGETEEETYQVYICTELDLDWREFFGSMMPNFASSNFMAGTGAYEGLMLEYHSINKKKPKKNHHWVTKNISKDIQKINKADYQFVKR